MCIGEVTFFFFQAEDGIRDFHVTGVQTCALPISGTLEIETNVEGADILVDDVLVGRSPITEPLLLDAGEHRVQVRKGGYSPHLEQLSLAGRDAKRLTIELEKLPEATVAPIIVEKQVIARDSDRSTWLWATWSATGAFAVGAAITGGFGIKAAGELE